MSSTGRAGDRQALDDYPTPRWCVHRLLERYALRGGLWVEPCAGSGSIIQAVSEVRSDVNWYANELNPAYSAAIETQIGASYTIGDALGMFVPAAAKVIITNPPFGPSLDLIRYFLQLGYALPIFLQRLNWAAGPRREIFREHLPSVYVLPDRPSFIDSYEPERPEALKAQTDSIEYAWFVFDRRGQFYVLDDTPSEDRAAEIEEGRRLGTRPKRALKPKSSSTKESTR